MESNLDHWGTPCFEELFATHSAAIRSFIASFVPRVNDAEDVMQETSVVMYEKFEHFEPGTDFLSWSFQIGKFQALNYLRKRSNDPLRFSDDVVNLLAETSINHTNVLEEDRRSLSVCIGTLDDSERELLSAYYWDQTKIKDYAASVRRTPNAVGKQLDRIRRKLFKCLNRAQKRERSLS